MAIPTSTREQIEALKEQPMTDTPLTERLAQASETLAAHQEWDDADAVREAIRFFSEESSKLADAKAAWGVKNLEWQGVKEERTFFKRRLAEVEAYAELTTRKAWKVLDTCAILDCACSLRERESGHRVGCAVPYQHAALDELRTVLRRDGEASTVTGAVIDEPGLDEKIAPAFPQGCHEIGTKNAGVAELVDASGLNPENAAGSTPAPRTTQRTAGAGPATATTPAIAFDEREQAGHVSGSTNKRYPGCPVTEPGAKCATCVASCEGPWRSHAVGKPRTFDDWWKHVGSEEVEIGTEIRRIAEDAWLDGAGANNPANYPVPSQVRPFVKVPGSDDQYYVCDPSAPTICALCHADQSKKPPGCPSILPAPEADRG